jgi:ubiquitin-conjugating enzyme E2 M
MKNSIEFPNKDDYKKFYIIISPSDGIWKDSKIKFELRIDDDYPFISPTCKCITKVFHPNIKNEQVDLNILRSNWSPTYTITDIIEGLYFLFLEPNPNDYMNYEAADIYLKNLDQFKKIAQNQILKNEEN